MTASTRAVFAGVTISLVVPEHHGFLLDLAQTRPEMWPRLCRDRTPSPHEFAGVLWAATALYVVADGARPCGLVGLFDWHQLNGTAWIELVPLAGAHEAEAVTLAGLSVLNRSWDAMALRHAYVAAADFQPVPLTDERWIVASQGHRTANAFAFGQRWDQEIYAITRRS